LRRGRSKRFRSVGQVLPAAVKRLGIDRFIDEEKVLELWPKAAGADVAQHTRALSLERGTLKIAVDSPAWMTQLIYLKPQLMRKLTGMAKRRTIKDIRFVLGR
jgi:predicted nucleic acid-binding Zn ribbon protein